MKAKALIYCIDDSRDELNFLELCLKEDYDIKCFTDARSALMELDSEEPDIIICDVMMPEIDGFEFAKNYFDLYSYRDTVIIFLSSLDDPEKISQLLVEGAYDYLTKPVSQKVLLAKINKALSYLDEKRSQKIVIDMANSDKEKIIRLLTNEFYNTKITIANRGNYETYDIFEGQLSDDTKNKILNAEGKIIISQIPIKKEKFNKKNISSSIKGKGLISKINIKDKIITIQTEVANYPYLHIQSIADLAGKVIDKQILKVENDFDEEWISKKIQELHISLENKIKEKLTIKFLGTKKEEKGFNQLLEDGFELYRTGKLKEALEIWLEAKRINPDNKILEVNIDILQKKLAKMAN